MTNAVHLREMTEGDLPILFEQQRDPAAVHMAAFTSKDPNDWPAFLAHWTTVLHDTTVIKRTIVVDGKVAGNVGSYLMFGERAVGYGLGRDYWGRGIATAALRAFLEIVTERPLYARAIKDNVASLRVLEKCGFVITGEDRGYANGRGAEVEEYILTLRASQDGARS